MLLFKTSSVIYTKCIPLLMMFVCATFLISCTNSSALQNQEPELSTPENPDITSKEVVFKLFLIGDTGNNFSTPDDPLMEVFKQKIDQASEQSAIVFLGDNLYPDGLPPENHASRKKMEDKLSGQLNVIKNFPGRIVFVPGNHDWQSSGPDGLEWVRRQERFIESNLDRGNTFLPDSGNPGPVQITLYEEDDEDTSFNIQLIALDTQWWLHPHAKPFDDNSEDQKQIIINEINNLLSNYPEDEIIVAAHHPLFSYGRHGGNFSIRPHLLPPIFGSLYVAYRNIWGLKQDLARYSDLKDKLLNSFEQVEGLIYASGHEHSLQYIPHEDDHFLVSGSASKTTYVKKKNDESFTYGEKGFIIIRYHRNRSKTIEFWNENRVRVYQNQVDKK